MKMNPDQFFEKMKEPVEIPEIVVQRTEKALAQIRG